MELVGGLNAWAVDWTCRDDSEYWGNWNIFCHSLGSNWQLTTGTTEAQNTPSWLLSRIQEAPLPVQSSELDTGSLKPAATTTTAAFELEMKYLVSPYFLAS